MEKCYFCEEGFNEEKLEEVRLPSGRWRYICESCKETHERTCSFCDDTFYSLDIYDNLCYDCTENTFVCEECGGRFRLDEEYRHDDYSYCENCYEEKAIIQDYNYKPSPTFRKIPGENTELFMGIELEIDGAGESSRNAKKIQDITDLIYIKHDGSLNEGFEVVSHPCTFSYHSQKFPWREILEMAEDLEYKSHDIGTCGLHIHISRDFFGNNYQEEDLNILKTLYIFEVFWSDILNFSRRTEKQAQKWAKKYFNKERTEKLTDPEMQKELLDTAKNSERYYAVNLQNEDTVEFRIFRGTLNYNTFLATLQFIYNLCNMVKDIDINNLQKISFLDICNYNKFPEMENYLKERGF